jgi:anaerobic magnesium-protoporphyrin IX monomethyl ester cyclase
MISRGDPETNRVKAAEHGLTFPIVLQQHWEISLDYAMFATPIAYLVDEQRSFMNIEKVTFIDVELPYKTLVTHALFPEYGTPLLATVVKQVGYDVQVFVEHVGPVVWDRVLSSDVVCFHAFSATMPRIIEYIRKIKASRPDMPIVIGGTHASVMAEDTLQYCDVVVRQEGDESLPEVLQRWKDDEGLQGVLGISYWHEGKVRHNPDRPFVREFEVIPDLELVHGYRDWGTFKLLSKLRMRWQLLQTSRGCPFDCSFCIAPRELGRAYRTRSVENIIADIKYQQELVGAKHFFIVDNHFTVNPNRTKEILNRIIEEKIQWRAICFSRLEVARDEELLKLLKQANVNTLYIGLESFSDYTLNLFNKKQTQQQIKNSLKTIRSHGLRVLGSFIMGSDEDTVSSMRANVETAIELDLDYMPLFPLFGYPEFNSPTIPLSRFFCPTWDRMDGNHVIFLPKNMKPSTLQREIMRAYRRFYGFKSIFRRVSKGDFWGAFMKLTFLLRTTEMGRDTGKWARYLETVEGPSYDKNERLIEERLGEGIHPARYPGSSRALMPVHEPMSVSVPSR